MNYDNDLSDTITWQKLREWVLTSEAYATREEPNGLEYLVFELPGPTRLAVHIDQVDTIDRLWASGAWLAH